MKSNESSSENLDITAVKTQLQQLKAQEAAQFAEIDVNELIACRSRFYDQLLQRLWRQFGLAQQPLALVAVGGYGREEMFPLSDLDILILSETALEPQQEQSIARLIQFLWDCRFEVGHSVRTVAQCIAEGKSDISIATNLLEARFLFGQTALFTQLQRTLNTADFWTTEAFFHGKMQEKEARYQRYNNTGYNLEPDIKYSPGGLRDLHLLYWIALRHVGAKNLQGILDSGFIYPEEHHILHTAQQFLFKLRFALHLVITRYDNRLLFDRQVKVSEMLGYQAHDGQKSGNYAVEEMMKTFFRTAHNVRELTELLLQHYQEHFINRRENSAAQPLDDNFELKNNAVQLRRPDCFIQQSDTILDLFYHLTRQPQAIIHSSALRRLRLALLQKQPYLVESPTARQKFLQLLEQPNAIARAFMPMHQHGVLNAYCEEWNNISGLMQFDLFHAYTVDEHTIRVLLKLESFLQAENTEQHPLCVELFPQLTSRSLIYMTALFHDIAKGRGGDHAELGAIDVYDFAQKHGFSEEDAEMMAWLVLNHLKMSVTAQRRDIYDPQVVLEFANSVKYQIRLDYLTCLTVADISATNSNLWNSWKRSLIRTLYQFTTQQLAQGTDYLLDVSDQILQHRLRALALLQPLLQDETLKLRTINDFWQRCPQDYFLRNNPQQLAWHVKLVCLSNDEIIVKSSNRFSQGGTELFVYCPDQPHLFNKVVRAIEAKNLSIHDAQILTSNDGYSLDSFIISEAGGVLAKFDRRRSIEESVLNALKSEYKPAWSNKVNNKLQHFHVPTEVRFINADKREQTELEIFALDKPGLLAMISNVFSELGINLSNAKITTIGERAEDFFILLNGNNRALSEVERERLQQALKTALSG
ncbi:bifunctional uridylyltransferase/uridylyl-removing protein [Chelonobacter oris]|uniref:bifunctional uridylyltransferase/uridylyl-removing protein GlnD n=1 Tax=Chelonobacter oris TaxID=505317 RepID=UPI0024486F78|nr:bifunctional uridylyltransferase/uridylyl-removing protein GlnD [Chelonobacter oris]MDH2999714.1 bifunctional uridylyltransferase/uridylyl-removing protein [Chelonobacter oris]